jgi:hypothetical protein
MAKRYAETKEEAALILARANAIAGQIFADDAEFWFIEERQIKLSVAKGWYFCNDDLGDAFVSSFQPARKIWRSNVLDPEFKMIAEDKACAILMHPKTGEVVAPYDGGFDVICRDGPSAATLKHIFAPWLSDRADGL